MGRSLILLLVTFFFQFTLWSGSEGLWRIETDLGSSGFDVYHVFIHAAHEGQRPQVDFYFAGWRPGTLGKVELEDANLHIALDQSGANIQFEVDLRRSPAEGTASLFHPQHQKKGKLFARKMFQRENWEPFQDLFEVRSEAGRIDLVEYVRLNFSGHSFQDFLNFWWDDVTPRFYPLLSFSIYSVAQGVDEAPLRSLYESLQAAGSYAVLDDRLEEAYDAVIEKIKDQMPGLAVANTLVVVPPFNGLQTDIFNIGELIFNYHVLTDVEGLTREQLQVRLARSILEVVALRLLPRQGTLSQQLHKEIAILYALRTLALTEDRALLLGIDSQNFQDLQKDLETHKARMLEDLKERDRTSGPRHFSQPPRTGKIVALDFVEKQTTELTPEALFRLSRKELGQHLATYFGVDQ